MRALQKTHPKHGLWLVDIPEPECKDDEVLVKIRQTAICGTDVHIYQWDEWSQKTIPTPMHIGHEFVGEIVKIGKLVKAFKEGDRVSGEGHIICNTCRNCRAGAKHLCINTKGLGINIPGCFAEYLAIPESNAFLVPTEISDDEAAILDPLGNAVHTATSFDLIGEDVLITGAGPIGIMAGAIAHYVGARHVVITDLNEYRLDLAKKLGIKNTLNIQKSNLNETMTNLNMTEGFDVGLEMSGSSMAINDIIGALKPGGRIALLGLLPNDTKLPWDQVIFKGLFMKGIFGREIFETWHKMCALIQSGLNIRSIVTHKLPVSQFEKAFDIMIKGQSGKVILDWQEK